MAAGRHVSEDLFERFLRAEVTPGERRHVVRHLLGGCPACTDLALRLGSRFWPRGEGAAEGAYEEVFQQAFAFMTEEERRIALEKLRGWGQWAALEPLNPQVRFAVADSDQSLHTFGLYCRLLEASRLYLRREPAEAVDIVRLAIVIAERIDPGRHGAARVADLRAAAWAELGNARRLASDLEGARRAFNEAWKILEEEGTNDPLEQARIITLEASYMNDIGEFETAESALEEALQLYRQVGDSHMEGRTLLKMGDAIGHVDPEKGIRHIRTALTLIETAREPRLELCARHDLAWYLNDLGNAEEALAVLEGARPLYAQFPDSYTQFRLHWLEARIAHSLGELKEAESTLQQLWEEFRARDLHHELALVSIDLAETLVKKGEPDRAAELIRQCHPILKSWGLHKHALAAWLVFQEAVAQQRIGTLFRRIREYYQRHWIRPARFEAE